MAPTGDRLTRRLRHLGALVTQRRVALGWSKDKARKEAGFALMTYMRVEDGLRVQAETYGKVERAFGLTAGACQAVLDGATGLPLVDGGVVTVETAESSTDDNRWEDLPRRIREELREGQILDSGVYDLEGGGSDAQLLTLIKVPSDATPEQIKQYMQLIRRTEREVRRIADSADESPDSNTP
jgi:hypothetical protein